MRDTHVRISLSRFSALPIIFSFKGLLAGVKYASSKDYKGVNIFIVNNND